MTTTKENKMTKLLPFTVTNAAGAETLIMATTLEDAITRATSARDANRDLDPARFARLFGTRPARYNLPASGLRQDLL